MGIYLSKALTCMISFLYKQKMFFIKETDTFSYIVVWTIYTSHIDHFTSQHTAYEQSTARLSVFLESLPGFTFKILTSYDYIVFIFMNVLSKIYLAVQVILRSKYFKPLYKNLLFITLSFLNQWSCFRFTAVVIFVLKHMRRSLRLWVLLR